MSFEAMNTGNYDKRAKAYYKRLKEHDSVFFSLRKRMKERNEDDDEVFDGNVITVSFDFKINDHTHNT